MYIFNLYYSAAKIIFEIYNIFYLYILKLEDVIKYAMKKIIYKIKIEENLTIFDQMQQFMKLKTF